MITFVPKHVDVDWRNGNGYGKNLDCFRACESLGKPVGHHGQKIRIGDDHWKHMELRYPHRVLASYLLARENLIDYGVSHAGRVSNRMFGFQEPLETHAFTKPWVTGPNNTAVVFGTKELFHDS